MRDRARQKLVAGVKSRRASARDLRQAPRRLRELQEEFKRIELLPETKVGEDRSSRYSRMLRLRTLRQDFEAQRPLDAAERPNGPLLALVMTVASFLVCAFCAGGAYTGLVLISQKPNPVDTGNAFWQRMEAQSYAEVRTTFLSPPLRVRFDQSQFSTAAKQADADYGVVTNASLIGQPVGDPNSQVVLTYRVTRTKNNKDVTYTTALTLTLHAGTWGIDDLGAAIDPHAGGLPAVASPTSQPTDTPTGLRGVASVRV